MELFSVVESEELLRSFEARPLGDLVGDAAELAADERGDRLQHGSFRVFRRELRPLIECAADDVVGLARGQRDQAIVMADHHVVGMALRLAAGRVASPDPHLPLL